MRSVIGNPTIYEHINLLFDESSPLFAKKFVGMSQTVIILSKLQKPKSSNQKNINTQRDIW